jgi:hypothetical protein
MNVQCKKRPNARAGDRVTGQRILAIALDPAITDPTKYKTGFAGRAAAALDRRGRKPYLLFFRGKKCPHSMAKRH